MTGSDGMDVPEMDEGYLNLASIAGVSRVRDTSTCKNFLWTKISAHGPFTKIIMARREATGNAVTDDFLSTGSMVCTATFCPPHELIQTLQDIPIRLIAI